MNNMGKRKVVTWQTAGGEARINICNACALMFRRQFERNGGDSPWPRHEVRGEYCSVYRGQHYGRCDVHPGQLVDVTDGGSWDRAMKGGAR